MSGCKQSTRAPRLGTFKPVPADDALILIAHYLPPEVRCFKMGREGPEYEHPPR